MRFSAYPVLLKILVPVALLVSSVPLSAAVPGSWKSIGPPGGSVYALVYAPSRPQTMYASVDGGVYGTTNGGASWAFARAGLTGIDAVDSLAVSPADPSTVYAVEDSGRLSKSLDGGASWTPTASFRVSRVVTPAKGSGTVYAVNYQGLYRSMNGGATWKKLTIGLPIPYGPLFLVADPVDPNRLYAEVVVDQASSETRLYTTADGGASWKPVGSRGLPADVYIAAIDPQFPQILYASGASDQIYKSRDRGASWRPVGIAPDSYLALQVDPSRSNVVFAWGGNVVARSEDGGLTWAEVPRSLPYNSQINALVFPPTKSGTLFLALATFGGFERGGVFASVNGGSAWTLRSTGFSTLDVTSIAVSPGVLWVAANDGLFKSEDQGATWPRVQVDSDGNLVSEVAVDPTDPDDVYAVADTGENPLLRSRDGGRSWNVVATPPPISILPIRLKFDPHTPSTLYAATGDNNDFDSFSKSTDGGETWTKLLSDLVSDFVISPSSPSTLYETGVLNGQPQIRRSTDGGATWTSIRASLPDGPFNTVAVDPTAPDTVYTVAGGLVFRSTDGGATWSSLGTPVPGGNLQSLLFPIGATAPYVAVDRDTVYQLAGGDTWAPLGRMTPSRYPLFSLLAADPRDPCRLYAGTVDRGVLVFTASGPGCP
jgi:photosystem II stability/assembly factor-like uncharacterized protein